MEPTEPFTPTAAQSTQETRKVGLLGHIVWTVLVLGMGSCAGGLIMTRGAAERPQTDGVEQRLDASFRMGQMMGGVAFPFVMAAFFLLFRRYRNYRSYIKIAAIFALLGLLGQIGQLGRAQKGKPAAKQQSHLIPPAAESYAPPTKLT